MIHDAGDGSTGRRVFTFALATPLHVIATDETAARLWLAEQSAGAAPADLPISDRGSADRTEILVWRDESYL